MSRLRRLLRSFDHYQQRRPALGFPIAVGKKFGDDQAGYLAALVAYFGFFSFFPLLLVLVTVLGFVLGRNSAASAGVVHTVLARVPIVGSQISAHGLRGSRVGLAVGLVFTLLAGIGVIQALQYGMNEIWEVPAKATAPAGPVHPGRLRRLLVRPAGRRSA